MTNNLIVQGKKIPLGFSAKGLLQAGKGSKTLNLNSSLALDSSQVQLIPLG